MNMDILVTVPRLPGPGATVLGSAARFAPGGKGGNQAVAAARLGARARMVGCVGDDDFGARLTGALRAESVDTSAVRLVPEMASGLALITVDPDGENMITVASGANQAVGDAEVSAALAAPAACWSSRRKSRFPPSPPRSPGLRPGGSPAYSTWPRPRPRPLWCACCPGAWTGSC